MTDMKSNLMEYYDNQYNRLEELELSDKVDLPSSRFEAFLHYFPKFFLGGTILELAAGDGRLMRSLLASNLPITGYTASEISTSGLELLKQTNDNRLSIERIDAEHIDEKGLVTYDVVIMLALIEHLIDPLLAMKKIRKIINPGGFVYIDTPNMAKFSRRLKLLFGRFPSTASVNEGLTTYWGKPTRLYDEGHLHYFTFRSISLMLTRFCGFSKIIKLPYPVGLSFFGKKLPTGFTSVDKRIHLLLSKALPTLFSELAIIAYV